ncbi:MAG: hypothetical protein VB048_05940, partial [Bacteroidaceae bacterium]|nr:hypothetical protein [Bacteroidaceae bacterium]
FKKLTFLLKVDFKLHEHSLSLGVFLLLDFWFLGCKSCKNWIYGLKHERDSLEYLVLEKKGIKIMSINALSDNAEKK